MSLTKVLSKTITELGFIQVNKNYFDTITFKVDKSTFRKNQARSIKT